MKRHILISSLALIAGFAGCSGDVIGIGTVCQTDEDCYAPMYCKDNICMSKSEAGEKCALDSDCIDGHLCIEKICVSQEDKPEQPGCNEDTPCLEGECIEGKCVLKGKELGEACTQDTDCADRLICHQDVCMKGILNNGNCKDAYTFCKEGQCIQGICKVLDGILDTDGDTIPDTYDTCEADTDGDTIPDCKDLDADGDTIPDAVEAQNNGDLSMEPVDTDSDMIYDFLDTDSDDNLIPDAYEGCPNPDFPYTGPDSVQPTALCDAPIDTDQDGIPDVIDDDNDGDGAMDLLEIFGLKSNQPPYESGRKCGNIPCTPGTPDAPWDSDGDTIYDYMDTDSDNDTIPDLIESTFDSNKDGELDRYVLDSDGDTIPDAQEVSPEGTPLVYMSPEGDRIYCYRTADCDLDGLLDNSEPVCQGVSGINNPDVDGDNYLDASELAAGIYAAEHGLLNGTYIPNADQIICDPTLGVKDVFEFYFELPWEGERKSDLLEFIPKVSRLDLVFNVDTTGSMTQAIQNVKSNVGQIIQKVQSMVPDSGFALVNFDDFPTGVGYMGNLNTGAPVVYPYGVASAGDLPFRVLGKISTNSAIVTSYTQDYRFTTRHGADGAESGAESLYHILTGEGTSWLSGSYSGYYLITSTTASYQTQSWTSGSIAKNINAPNTWGGVDFRTGSLPVVVHTTDVYSHDAPSIYNTSIPTEYAYNQYVTSIPNPHYTADIVPKFKEKGMRVITLGVPNQSGGETYADQLNQMTTWARESNAIVPACAFEGACGINRCCLGSRTTIPETINGQPNQCVLYYTSAQTDVSTYISKGVDALVKYGTYEVATLVQGEPIPGSSVDTSCFIKQVKATAYIPPPQEPEKSCNPTAEATSVNGADYQNGFKNFAPGTSDPNREGARLHFTVYAQNDNCVPATEEAQVFRAYIDVINPTTGLSFGQRQVSIIVPGELHHDQIN